MNRKYIGTFKLHRIHVDPMPEPARCYCASTPWAAAQATLVREVVACPVDLACVSRGRHTWTSLWKFRVEAGGLDRLRQELALGILREAAVPLEDRFDQVPILPAHGFE